MLCQLRCKRPPLDLRLGLGLADEGLVDVRDDTSAGDCGLDHVIKFLVTSDGELQVTRSDTLHLQILARVAGELEDLGGQVLEDGRCVDRSGGTDASV